MYYIGMHDADYVSIYIEKMLSVGDDFAAAYFRLWNITSKMLLNRIPVVQFIDEKKANESNNNNYNNNSQQQQRI